VRLLRGTQTPVLNFGVRSLSLDSGAGILVASAAFIRPENTIVSLGGTGYAPPHAFFREYSLSSIKPITLMLILLTFVSQAFASVILPCAMEMQTTQGLSHSPVPGKHDACDSSKERLSQTSQVDGHPNSHADCCDSQCHCPMGSCLSVALSMSYVSLASEIQASCLMPESVASLLPQHKLSLYRPPILA
jgi:hypothetical protein